MEVPFSALGNIVGVAGVRGGAEGLGGIGHVEFEVLYRYFWNLPEKKKL